MSNTAEVISLRQLTARLGSAIAAAPGLTGVWITAETSDLRVAGGHCYMELIEKDESGRQLAKCRAAIWASTFARLNAEFVAATGTQLRSDIKIMVQVNVSFHQIYGLCLVINNINPDYTIGDLARRRNEIIRRLKAEGVYDLNGSLPWPELPRRIAVISSRGAAGFGDFMQQLHNNRLRLRFDTDLYEAALQGERTSQSIIAALEAINERIECYDCVVIIRGGGAVSDLASFDDYALAAHVAQFPLPIIVGIGHERDVTVLDYVAHTRVKTPTAAAEILVARMTDAYAAIANTGRDILELIKASVAGRRQQLAYCAGLLPALATNVINANKTKIGRDISSRLSELATGNIERRRQRLTAIGEIIDALSPEHTLRRGYSITRINGHAVKDPGELRPGDIITTTFAQGTPVNSTVNEG